MKPRYLLPTKEKAKTLRRKGFTHREIAKLLKISLGSASLWTKNIYPTLKQKAAIMERFKKKVFTKKVRKLLGEYARKRLSPYWKIPYSKERLLQKIKYFHDKYRRIPLKREFNMYREYRERFGSWNNAIKLAGFKPHEVIFTKKFQAKDGHICDSFSEKIIDDWLAKNKIPHKHNIPYGNTKMTADFAIKNTRLEFFGLAGVNKTYDRIVRLKQKFCAKNKLHLIEIYPQDIYCREQKIFLKNVAKKIKNVTA